MNEALLFILLIIMPDGSLEVKADIVDKCPPSGLLTAQMETKKIHNEILGWTGACITVDKKAMMADRA